MGNLDFYVTPSQPDSVPQLTARIKAVSSELRDEVRAILKEAVAEGARVARIEAPRGNPGEGQRGRRISDSIVTGPIRYHPGGGGGGGYYEMSLEASSEIAPHLPFVFEGTGERGEFPTGKILPAKGNVMVIEKQGEGASFVRWTRGQMPQQKWWQDAHAAVEERLDFGFRSMQI